MSSKSLIRGIRRVVATSGSLEAEKSRCGIERCESLPMGISPKQQRITSRILAILLYSHNRYWPATAGNDHAGPCNILSGDAGAGHSENRPIVEPFAERGKHYSSVVERKVSVQPSHHLILRHWCEVVDIKTSSCQGSSHMGGN